VFRPRPSQKVAIAALAAVALTLSGCVVVGESPRPSTSTITDPQAFGAAGDFYTQQLQWRGCNDDMECAEVLAPLNWDAPQETIRIAVMRSVVSNPIGSLLINPGGPGSSGINWMRDNFSSIATSGVRERFSLVAFDPRGVGQSTAVTCRDKDLKDELLYSQSPFELGSPEDYRRTEKLLIDFATDCIAGSGDLLGYVDTQSAARDLDLLRHLLGDEKINYLGFSYGTELGSTYAALFPDRVGRMVLDGAIDPTLTEEQGLIAQADGFDRAFRAYLTDCLENTGCPFSGTTEDALLEVAQFFESLESAALPTESERMLSLSSGLTGVIAALYSQFSWPFLTQAFDEALAGDGTTLLFFADLYNDRNREGSYDSNLIEANIAINCADGRYDQSPESVQQTLADLETASPLFGKYFGDPSLSCFGWPAQPERPTLDYAVPLASSPLVIGTTGDPATPYAQAVSLSRLLSGARLITFEGEGHTIYGGESACVNNAVDDYLLRGELPSEDLECR
jgi:pimeloyl-ACP methyl ester carboxylesterase